MGDVRGRGRGVRATFGERGLSWSVSPTASRTKVTLSPGSRWPMRKPAERHALTCGRSPDHQARWWVADGGSPPTISSRRSQDSVSCSPWPSRNSASAPQFADITPVLHRGERGTHIW